MHVFNPLQTIVLFILQKALDIQWFFDVYRVDKKGSIARNGFNRQRNYLFTEKQQLLKKVAGFQLLVLPNND